MKQTRRAFLMKSATLAAAFVLPAGLGRAGEGARAKLLRWVPHADLSVVDPLGSTSYITQIFALTTFDTLFGLDENYEAHLQMAQAHSVSADGLMHEITLRDGLMFHDESPVVAADCVASIYRWMDRSGLAKSLAAVVENVEAKDDKTIVFTLNSSFPLLPVFLGRPQSGCAIMKAEQANSEGQVDRPIGSGPYKMVWDEWVQGSRVVFERFDKYVPRPGEPSATFNAGAKIAAVDRIEWHIVPDAATAIAALQAGEVDGVETVPLDFVPVLHATPGVSVIRNGVPTAGVMRFNQLHAPFNDPKVRQAVLAAVDQTSFMGALFGGQDAGGFTNTQTGLFTPDTPMDTARGMQALNGPRDLEAARKMLEDAGALGAQITVIDTVSIPVLHVMALVGADLFKKLGFDVKIETLDWGATLQRREQKAAPSEGGWSVMFTAMSGVNNLDPIGHLAVRAIGEDGWFGWPKSDALEALRDAWIAAPSQEERIDLAGKLQEQAFVDVPYIPLGSVYAATALRDEWSGYQRQMPAFYTMRKS